MDEELRTENMKFNIKQEHQLKIVGTIVKKGLAQKLETGYVVVLINGKMIHRFDIPKDVDRKFVDSVRYKM